MIEYDRYEAGGEHIAVLLHSLALDRSVWEGVIELLRDDIDLVAIDLPGHGKSSTFDGGTIEEMADEVAGLIAAEKMGPALIVGLSLGGCVAQALAVGHPELVTGLGLVDTTSWYGDGAPEAWEQRARRAREDGLASLAEFQLARWFTPAFLAAYPDVGERLLDVFRTTDLDSYSAACRAMGVFDIRSDLPGIDVPTSVVVGADDPATSPAHSEELHRLIPGATLHVIADCSHLSAVERPDEVVRILREELLPRL